MASSFKVLVFISLLLITLRCQEIINEGLDGHESPTLQKRSKFAFVEGYPSRFAFAKRFDNEDMNWYDEKPKRFDFPTHSMQRFAFAKRRPYLLFA